MLSLAILENKLDIPLYNLTTSNAQDQIEPNEKEANFGSIGNWKPIVISTKCGKRYHILASPETFEHLLSEQPTGPWEPPVGKFGIKRLCDASGNFTFSLCLQVNQDFAVLAEQLCFQEITVSEGDAVDSKADSNGAAIAVEAKVINGHAEQEAIYQMMLPYLELQVTAKFGYI
ncbi:hypothetical protein MAM1_1043d11430 [Mucor ambiguus]|uniref:Uncharacterized protein n=1 Tax=Mucor ambiguus TaxID=91626 RepID=A0A0C9MM36_9FUNG|nr:hypothetical protein MAM1_1043d11430 [Mucor ambiguus]